VKPNEVEQAITIFTEDRTEARFDAMQRALVDGEFLIPVSDEGVQSQLSVHSIPVICFTTDEGHAAAPAFTTLQRLLEWKPQGVKYVELEGHKLIEMVDGMAEIDLIAINPGGGPRGLIPREDFLRLLSMYHVGPGQSATNIRRRPNGRARTMVGILALLVAATIAAIIISR
jgi:hypothetical protein